MIIMNEAATRTWRVAFIGLALLVLASTLGIGLAYANNNSNSDTKRDPLCEKQHYSLKGSSGIGKDETPAFPADYWQANTKQEPHRSDNVTWIGTVGMGLHYTSAGSSGKRDWFYYEEICTDPTQEPTEEPTEEPTGEPTAQGSETPTPEVTVTETTTPVPGPTVTETKTPEPGPTVTETKTAKPEPGPTVTKTAKPQPVPLTPAKPRPKYTPKSTTPSLPKCSDVAKELKDAVVAKDGAGSEGVACAS